MIKNKDRLSQEWFRQAEYDLETADAMFKSARYIYTVFMCHLAIEKALKGLYLSRLGEIPPKTHNLQYLFVKIDIRLPEELYQFLKRLSKISAPIRYPEDLQDTLKEYDIIKTGEILESAKELLKWIGKK